MRTVIGAVLLVAGIVYPFWVYATLGRLNPSWVMLPLFALWLARALTSQSQQPGGRLLPAITLAYCLALVGSGSQQWLRGYPVFMNAVMLAVFAHSLRHGPPIIERIARLRHPDLSEHGVRYTHRITQIWCAFFLLNGAMAAALALWAPWGWWTAYNGGISYALIGLLLAGERLLRPFIQKVT